MSGKALRVSALRATLWRGMPRWRRPKKSNISSPTLVMRTPRSLSLALPPKKRMAEGTMPPNQDGMGSTVSIGFT